MAGRPRKDATPEQRRDIVRRFRRGQGRERIAVLGGHPEWLVRHVLEQARLSRPSTREQAWDIECRADLRPKGHEGPYTHRDHLRHTAGERSVKRLARELRRTHAAVTRELWALGLSMPDLRVTLTLAQCCRLTGMSEPGLTAAIRRRELRAHQGDGAWRVHPSDLRAWLVGRLSSVDLERVVGNEDVEPGDRQAARIELMGLLAGLWGVKSEDDT